MLKTIIKDKHIRAKVADSKVRSRTPPLCNNNRHRAEFPGHLDRLVPPHCRIRKYCFSIRNHNDTA
jgi:hypothetical protein